VAAVSGDLDELGRAQRDFAAGYRLGYATGYDHGRHQAEQDMARAWRLAAQRVRATLAAPTFAELQRRRGEAS
jgi:hypothetical protein